jgi:hypothetical protein
MECAAQFSRRSLARVGAIRIYVCEGETTVIAGNFCPENENLLHCIYFLDFF